MDDKEDFVDESPQALEHEPAEADTAAPAPDVERDPGADETENPASLDPRKPGLYLLRPRGLRPPPRPQRKRPAWIRNDCPPDRRRPSLRASLKPRLR